MHFPHPRYSYPFARACGIGRRYAPRTYQPGYRVYLLNGIVYCDICDRKLRAQGARAGDYYHEVPKQEGFVGCPERGVG